jgi:hypothetical protein
MTNDNPEQPKEEQQPKAHEPQPRPSYIPPFLTGRTYQGIVDQRIADAEAQGKFRDLQGAGRPLRLDDDALVPEEDRAAYRLLKNAGFAPPWIELQKQIRDDETKIAAWLKRANERWPASGPMQRDLLRDEYRDRLRNLAKLVDHYNLIIPNGVRQIAGVRVVEELKKLGQSS